MGSFYVNVTLLGVGLDAVREAWPGPAFAYEESGDVVLFAEADDEQHVVTAGPLSEMLGCVAVGVGVHDDDICFWNVYRSGELVVSGALPDPVEYFDLDEELVADMSELAGDVAEMVAPPPDAEALVDAIGRGDVAALRAALAGDVVFASDRHRAVVTALGLPPGAVGWGYRYLAQDPDTWTGPPLTRW